MSLLAPAFLYAALGLAAGVIALHFIVTRRPPAAILPTARFIPDGSARSPSRALRPEDLLLLFLRVLLVVTVGVAFARPVVHPVRRSVARVVLIDQSRAVNSITEVRDSALAYLQGQRGDGAAVVVFDSSARALSRTAWRPDSVKSSVRRGNISAAIVVALRQASELRRAADSLELVIISPFAREEIDAATTAVRALWLGRIRLSRVAARSEMASSHVTVRATERNTDPLALVMRARQRQGSAVDGPRTVANESSPVRLIRDELQPEDLRWGNRAANTLVHWPAHDTPQGWTARAVNDTVGAVSAGPSVVVAPFERRFRVAETTRPSRVIARWVDGEPAAIEQRAADGSGCVRSVAIPVPSRGDLILRHAFAELLLVLTQTCGAPETTGVITAAQLTAFRGAGALAATSSLQPSARTKANLVPWLLAASMLLLLCEQKARRARLGR